MARYVCDTCGEERATFKTRNRAISHLRSHHKIAIQDRWEFLYRTRFTSDWTRKQFKEESKKLPFKYYCRSCDAKIKNIVSLLKHCSTKHGVIMWYERRITKKIIYLDGL